MGRDPKEDIDEVFPRIYMSGFKPADCWETLQRCGITHILTLMPSCRKKFKKQGIVYKVISDIQDNGS